MVWDVYKDYIWIIASHPVTRSRMDKYILIALIVAYVSAEGYKQGPHCYNCNYSKRNTHGHYPSGTSICALDQITDYERVDKWPCKSGICFIRQDKNGLIYRGCGNSANLPYGVSSDQQCLVQRYTGSVWWFCEGDLCNNGTIGETPARCEEAIDMQEAMTTNRPHPPTGYAPSNPPPEEQPPVVPEEPTYAPTPVRPVPSIPPQPSIPPRPTNPEPSPTYYQGTVEEVVHTAPPAPIENQQTYAARPMEEIPVEDTVEVVDDTPLPNPCDGKCVYNPSGLFADPRDTAYFIQCGAGYGCTCCKPYYLRCPIGTLFDDENKICSINKFIVTYSDH